MSLMSLTAVELGKKIKSGEVKVKDAVFDAFAQIEAVEENINSYVTVLNKEEIICVSRDSLPHVVQRFFQIFIPHIRQKRF